MIREPDPYARRALAVHDGMRRMDLPVPAPLATAAAQHRQLQAAAHAARESSAREVVAGVRGEFVAVLQARAAVLEQVARRVRDGESPTLTDAERKRLRTTRQQAEDAEHLTLILNDLPEFLSDNAPDGDDLTGQGVVQVLSVLYDRGALFAPLHQRLQDLLAAARPHLQALGGQLPDPAQLLHDDDEAARSHYRALRDDLAPQLPRLRQLQQDLHAAPVDTPAALGAYDHVRRPQAWGAWDGDLQDLGGAQVVLHESGTAVTYDSPSAPWLQEPLAALVWLCQHPDAEPWVPSRQQRAQAIDAAAAAVRSAVADELEAESVVLGVSA